MGNDLTTTTDSQSATRWSRPLLPTSLAALVADPNLWSDPDRSLPALSEEDRASAQRALAVYGEAPRGSSPAHIAKLFGSAAAAMPTKAVSEDEAALRLEVYQAALADIDQDLLATAFSEAVRTLRFFPTVAEVREIAGRLPAPPRVKIAWRLRQLVAVPVPAPDEEMASPADLLGLAERLAAAARRQRAAA